MSRRSSSRNPASPGAATHAAICGALRNGSRASPGEHGSAAPVATSSSPAASPQAQTRPMASRCGGAAVIGLVSNSAAVSPPVRCAPASLPGHQLAPSRRARVHVRLATRRSGPTRSGRVRVPPPRTRRPGIGPHGDQLRPISHARMTLPRRRPSRVQRPSAEKTGPGVVRSPPARSGRGHVRTQLSWRSRSTSHSCSSRRREPLPSYGPRAPVRRAAAPGCDRRARTRTPSDAEGQAVPSCRGALGVARSHSTRPRRRA